MEQADSLSFLLQLADLEITKKDRRITEFVLIQV
jgi:hypothetical protein